MSQSKYVVCIDNSGYLASLETRKIYQKISDEKAESLGQIRVIDESGEDYLYPIDRFLPVELSSALADALSNAA